VSGPPERTVLGDLTQDHRTTLLRFLPHRDEAARTAGYEWGRRAVASGVSLLDVCRLHHEVTVEVLRDTDPSDVLEVLDAATDLLLEALAAYDMTQRGVLET
jgi:hypothetical protein